MKQCPSTECHSSKLSPGKRFDGLVINGAQFRSKAFGNERFKPRHGESLYRKTRFLRSSRSNHDFLQSFVLRKTPPREKTPTTTLYSV